MSPTPDLILTHKGNSMVTIYVGANMFVDHYSDFTYFQLTSKISWHLKEFVFHMDSYSFTIMHIMVCLTPINVGKYATQKNILSFSAGLMPVVKMENLIT